MTGADEAPLASVDTKRSTWAGAIIGVGLMAAVDEIVFHQLLSWHHFYDRSTTAIALLSDGLLHAAELIAIIAGGYALLELHGRGTLARAWTWAGLLVGLGAFQLFDGLINHKVLRLHQIRYDVPLLPYDIAWNLTGALLLCIGLVMLARLRRRR